jgi:glucosamine--fructose-6-phosphate aminotransferase (isomerizing)
MCGVFGFVSFDGNGPSIKRLGHIATKTMRRGPHAFGFAWIDGKGRLRMFKKTGRIVDHLGLLAMAADARFLIGHCRYATHGSPSNNLNNHPHPADGGWIVHNGVIGRYEDLIARNDLAPVTDCDSEVLGMLLERGRGTLRNRCVEAVQEAASTALVMLGLWARPHRMLAIRAGNPLSMGVCKTSRQNRVYLGSLADGLPGDVSEIKDNTGLEFSSRNIDEIKLPSFAKTLEVQGAWF